MAENLIDLRRRIGSVKNTQKITRAMKTVSAAKLRRSVGEVNKTVPYRKKIEYLLQKIGNDLENLDSPFYRTDGEGKQVIVVVAADKGLCGAFNAHVIKRAETLYAEYREEGVDVELITIGKKPGVYFAKREYPILKRYDSLISNLTFNEAMEISVYLQKLFLDKEAAGVRFVFMQYISSGKQEVTDEVLFPLTEIKGEDESSDDVEYIFEPSLEEIYSALLPKYINSSVYGFMLQSMASEHTARMMAMDLATKNASEMISNLTLTMNKLRQAAITNELLEIITATEALQK